MLADLPIELLVKVFDGLDVFSLVSCKFVNRSFNKVIKSSSLLQYKLELGLSGVEANPTCTLGLSECLETVRSYRRDWENLAWSSTSGWREAFGNISYSRGTFILGEFIMRDDDDPQFKLRTQRFQPKSKHRRLEERTWSEDRPATTFAAIDPSQDLLFAMPDEGNIHILTLSTFDPYPGVADPTIFIPVGRDSSVEIDIYGSNFVASTHLRLTFKYQDNILVYNWMTGTILAEIFYPCDDFFLLNEELVACYVTGRGPTDRPSHFAIFPVPDTRNATSSEPPQSTSTPLCVFNLPHPTGDKNWYLTQGRLNSSRISCPPPENSTIPFYSSGRRQLLSLWLLPSRTFWRNPECSLIIPLWTLLHHIPSKPSPSTIVFDWDAWGPRGSRLLSSMEARHTGLQFGWKIAQLGPPDLSTIPQGPSREIGITVYDFNPLPFHRPPDAIESGESVGQESEPMAGGRLRRVVTSPNSFPDSVELEGIQTFLPYRVTSAPLELCERATDLAQYEISLGEDGMIVWTHVGFIAGNYAFLKDTSADALSF
ncbi:hypothetical protein BDM02DRAFT_3184831 [Thelephora ganbajun]|uniref:Uncharacterized protein n=1 Tax=Thelephora ganbajun TaxID=370292 RepID=A0ACB6ZND8_THEGA|nr:hypothetical protein BDM02DRAFT_3184831 [Thelephora ganbajun]